MCVDRLVEVVDDASPRGRGSCTRSPSPRRSPGTPSGTNGAGALVGVDGHARRREARRAPAGSSRSAAPRCTSSVSTALQTLGALHLGVAHDVDGPVFAGATRRGRRARRRRRSRSRAPSTRVTTVWMSSALPRGISTSTRPRARISSAAPSRPNSSMVCTASAGSPAAAERVLDHLDEHAVRARCAALPPRSTDGVAALERERGDVDGHVRPRLVDRADDAERHAHLGDLHAVRQRAAAHRLPDRVGERDDLEHGVGEALRAAPGVERQPVEQPGRQAVLAAVGEVELVGREDVGGAPRARRRRWRASARFFWSVVAVASARDAVFAAASRSCSEGRGGAGR